MRPLSIDRHRELATDGVIESGNPRDWFKGAVVR
jgi:hypothetical protein